MVPKNPKYITQGHREMFVCGCKGEEVAGADLTLGNRHETSVPYVCRNLGVTRLLNTSIHSASKSRNELA